MTPDGIVRRAAMDRQRLGGINAISAFAAPDLSPFQIAAAGDVPHRVLMASTVGRVRGAGFEVRRTGRWPHCTIELGEACDTDVAARLIDVFDEVQG